MFSKTTKRASLISTSVTYAQSPLILVVPPGAEISSFSKLLSPFDDSVWIIVNTMMLVIIFVTFAIKCQSTRVQDFVFGRRNRTPLLNLLNIIVGSPTHRNPTRNFARWLLMMFVLMWLIFRSLFQAVLFKNLQSTERYLPVQTIEETIRQNFDYYMLAATQENIVNLPEVFNRRVVVSRSESEEIMARFNDPSLKAAFLGALDTANYATKIKLYGFALNVCPEPLMLRHYGIIFPKDSFLVPSFDEKLIVLVENGLIEYWLSEFTEKARYEATVREPIPLTLSHLLCGFHVLWIGVSFSAVAFAVEVISLRVKCLRTKGMWLFCRGKTDE